MAKRTQGKTKTSSIADQVALYAQEAQRLEKAARHKLARAAKLEKENAEAAERFMKDALRLDAESRKAFEKAATAEVQVLKTATKQAEKVVSIKAKQQAKQAEIKKAIRSFAAQPVVDVAAVADQAPPSLPVEEVSKQEELKRNIKNFANEAPVASLIPDNVKAQTVEEDFGIDEEDKKPYSSKILAFFRENKKAICSYTAAAFSMIVIGTGAGAWLAFNEEDEKLNATVAKPKTQAVQKQGLYTSRDQFNAVKGDKAFVPAAKTPSVEQKGAAGGNTNAVSEKTETVQNQPAINDASRHDAALNLVEKAVEIAQGARTWARFSAGLVESEKHPMRYSANKEQAKADLKVFLTLLEKQKTLNDAPGAERLAGYVASNRAAFARGAALMDKTGKKYTDDLANAEDRTHSKQMKEALASFDDRMKAPVVKPEAVKPAVTPAKAPVKTEVVKPAVAPVAPAVKEVKPAVKPAPVVKEVKPGATVAPVKVEPVPPTVKPDDQTSVQPAPVTPAKTPEALQAEKLAAQKAADEKLVGTYNALLSELAGWYNSSLGQSQIAQLSAEHKASLKKAGEAISAIEKAATKDNSPKAKGVEINRRAKLLSEGLNAYDTARGFKDTEGSLMLFNRALGDYAKAYPEQKPKNLWEAVRSIKLPSLTKLPILGM